MLKNLNPAVALASLTLAGAAVWTTQTSGDVVLAASKLNNCDVDIDPPASFEADIVRITWEPITGTTHLALKLYSSGDDLLVVRDDGLSNSVDLEEATNTITLKPVTSGGSATPTKFQWEVTTSSGTEPPSGTTWELPAVGSYDATGISEVTLERPQVVGSTRRMRMWVTHKGLGTMLHLQDK